MVRERMEMRCGKEERKREENIHEWIAKGRKYMERDGREEREGRLCRRREGGK